MDVTIIDVLNGLLKGLIDMTWPEGSEGGLTKHSDEYELLNGALVLAQDEVSELRRQLGGALTGDFAAGVDRFLRGIDTALGQAAGSTKKLRKGHLHHAAELQETKILVVVQLTLLLVQIQMLINSVVGALAIPAVVATFRAVIQAILTQLLFEVAQELIEEPLLVMVIRAAQMEEGAREDMAWDEIGDMAVGAAIGGAFGALAFFGADVLAGWVARKLKVSVGTTPDGGQIVVDKVFRTGYLLGKGAAQAGASVFGDVAGQAALGHDIRWNWSSATSGFVGGLEQNSVDAPTDVPVAPQASDFDGAADEPQASEKNPEFQTGTSTTTAGSPSPGSDDESANDSRWDSDDETVAGEDNLSDSDDDTVVGDDLHSAKQPHGLGEESSERAMGTSPPSVSSPDARVRATGHDRRWSPTAADESVAERGDLSRARASHTAGQPVSAPGVGVTHSVAAPAATVGQSGQSQTVVAPQDAVGSPTVLRDVQGYPHGDSAVGAERQAGPAATAGSLAVEKPGTLSADRPSTTAGPAEISGGQESGNSYRTRTESAAFVEESTEDRGREQNEAHVTTTVTQGDATARPRDSALSDTSMGRDAAGRPEASTGRASETQPDVDGSTESSARGSEPVQQGTFGRDGAPGGRDNADGQQDIRREATASYEPDRQTLSSSEAEETDRRGTTGRPDAQDATTGQSAPAAQSTPAGQSPAPSADSRPPYLTGETPATATPPGTADEPFDQVRADADAATDTPLPGSQDLSLAPQTPAAELPETTTTDTAAERAERHDHVLLPADPVVRTTVAGEVTEEFTAVTTPTDSMARGPSSEGIRVVDTSVQADTNHARQDTSPSPDRPVTTMRTSSRDALPSTIATPADSRRDAAPRPITVSSDAADDARAGSSSTPATSTASDSHRDADASAIEGSDFDERLLAMHEVPGLGTAQRAAAPDESSAEVPADREIRGMSAEQVLRTYTFLPAINPQRHLDDHAQRCVDATRALLARFTTDRGATVTPGGLELRSAVWQDGAQPRPVEGYTVVENALADQPGAMGVIVFRSKGASASHMILVRNHLGEAPRGDGPPIAYLDPQNGRAAYLPKNPAELSFLPLTVGISPVPESMPPTADGRTAELIGMDPDHPNDDNTEDAEMDIDPVLTSDGRYPRPIEADQFTAGEAYRLLREQRDITAAHIRNLELQTTALSASGFVGLPGQDNVAAITAALDRLQEYRDRDLGWAHGRSPEDPEARDHTALVDAEDEMRAVLLSSIGELYHALHFSNLPELQAALSYTSDHMFRLQEADRTFSRIVRYAIRNAIALNRQHFRYNGNSVIHNAMTGGAAVRAMGVNRDERQRVLDSVRAGGESQLQQPEIYAVQAVVARHYGIANCGEHAASLYTQLWLDLPGVPLQYVSHDISHAFVVVGDVRYPTSLVADSWPESPTATTIAKYFLQERLTGGLHRVSAARIFQGVADGTDLSAWAQDLVANYDLAPNPLHERLTPLGVPEWLEQTNARVMYMPSDRRGWNVAWDRQGAPDRSAYDHRRTTADPDELNSDSDPDADSDSDSDSDDPESMNLMDYRTADDGGSRGVMAPATARFFAGRAVEAGWVGGGSRGLGVVDTARAFVQEVVTAGVRLRDDFLLPDYGLYRHEVNGRVFLVRAVVDDAGRLVHARQTLPLDQDTERNSGGHQALAALRDAGWSMVAGPASRVDEVRRELTLDVLSGTAWQAVSHAYGVMRLRDVYPGDRAGAGSVDRAGWLAVGQVRDGGAVVRDRPWLGREVVNPSGSLTNCVLAAIVTDGLWRTDGRDHFVAPESVATEVGLLSWYAESRPLRRVASFEVIVEAMVAAPAGAAGIVVVDGGHGEIAHAFNVLRDDSGDVIFWDGQSGQPAMVPPTATAIRFVSTTDGVPDVAAQPVDLLGPDLSPLGPRDRAEGPGTPVTGRRRRDEADATPERSTRRRVDVPPPPEEVSGWRPSGEAGGPRTLRAFLESVSLPEG
ncbi:toxin glutamine deamidase domain-containing protein, partial [Micromonospora chokoriensis]